MWIPPYNPWRTPPSASTIALIWAGIVAGGVAWLVTPHGLGSTPFFLVAGLLFAGQAAGILVLRQRYRRWYAERMRENRLGTVRYQQERGENRPVRPPVAPILPPAPGTPEAAEQAELDALATLPHRTTPRLAPPPARRRWFGR
jgi:hypothetical protein